MLFCIKIGIMYLMVLLKFLSVMQPHQDGPAYFPVVAIISLGSPVVIDFTPHSSLKFCPSTCTNNVKDESCDEVAPAIESDGWLDNHRPFSVLLMPRSLLIFKDTAYSGRFTFFVLEVTASSS